MSTKNLLFWWRHQSNKNPVFFEAFWPYWYPFANDTFFGRWNYFGNKMLCSSSFSGDSMSSYDTLEVKAAASHRWLDSYITQNNKKDGTQPHDDDNVVVDARLLAPVMWRHRDKMANETNDFSTPHVGTSSYDFIALGSILKPLRRPTTTLFWMPYIWSPRWERVFYEASTIEFLKPFLVFLVSSVFKTLFGGSNRLLQMIIA